MVEQLGIEPSPFASEAAVLETACAPYTTAHSQLKAQALLVCVRSMMETAAGAFDMREDGSGCGNRTRRAACGRAGV